MSGRPPPGLTARRLRALGSADELPVGLAALDSSRAL